MNPDLLVEKQICLTYATRALVRGGATGAIAPGIFEKVGLSPRKNLGVKFQKRKELSNFTEFVSLNERRWADFGKFSKNTK